MPEFPIPSARILLVSQIQGGQLPPCPPVRYAYATINNVFCLGRACDGLETRRFNRHAWLEWDYMGGYNTADSVVRDMRMKQVMK